MNDEKDGVITLEGEDGDPYPCKLLDIFEFEGTEYSLLLPMDKDGLVVMRLAQRDNQTIFQTIESDDEYNRVVAYLEEMARRDERP
jgi:hypothetical protein